jgi:2-phosphoglycerate kinase
MKSPKKDSHIVISDGQQSGLPYSKGLMASRVMITGLSPYRAYQVAERIEEVLKARGVPSVTRKEVNGVAVRVLEEVAGSRPASGSCGSWLPMPSGRSCGGSFHES